MNGGNKTVFQRLGLVALVALLALCAASAPALADGSGAVAINPNGSVASGVATVSGTLSASTGTELLVAVRVSQFRHGHASANAFTDVFPIVADGSTQTWTAAMFSSVGYKSGHAQVTVELYDFSTGNVLAVAGATVKLGPN